MEYFLNASYLADKFAAGLPYEQYVGGGTADQQRRWKQVHGAAALDPTQLQMVRAFEREMKILLISGIWCGDCVQQCPLIARIAEANFSKIELRLLDRDEHRDLADALRFNAGNRVPIALLMAEDYELCSIFGDRTINRYRALARNQLGPSCPTGIVPPEKDELLATLADWLTEIERVQLMLRLSPRLRKKHND